jgi:hypothetical protein
MITILRVLLLIAGAFLVISGSFFALQGAGIIMWPADSFMLADASWILYGLLIAAMGAALIYASRRIGRTV